MKDHFPLQSLLLRWLGYHGERGQEQIRVAANSLMKSFNLEAKSSLHKVFYPLVRTGVIEFSGKGKYKLSPTVIFLYEKEDIAIGINLSDANIKELIDSNCQIKEEGLPGIIRFNKNEQISEDLLTLVRTGYSEQQLIFFLKNLPKLLDVVKTFERININNSGQYYDLKNSYWNPVGENKIGLFRHDKDSQKFYLRLADGDYEVPNQIYNPEGRYIAEYVTAQINNLECFVYNKSTKELTINHINTPFVLERILRLFSLSQPNGVVISFKKQLYKHIPMKAIKELMRISDMGVKIVE